MDALLRGHVQYKSSNGEATTLSLINRQNSKEIMQKEFPDGDIDEYISLGRFELPAEQIGALIKGADGQVLENLKPKE